MSVSPRRRLLKVTEDLEKGHERIARLAATHRLLRERLRRKALSSFERYQLAARLIGEHDLSVQRACRLVELRRSSFYYHQKVATA